MVHLQCEWETSQTDLATFAKPIKQVVISTPDWWSYINKAELWAQSYIREALEPVHRTSVISICLALCRAPESWVMVESRTMGIRSVCLQSTPSFSSAADFQHQKGLSTEDVEHTALLAISDLAYAVTWRWEDFLYLDVVHVLGVLICITAFWPLGLLGYSLPWPRAVNTVVWNIGQPKAIFATCTLFFCSGHQVSSYIYLVGKQNKTDELLSLEFVV